MPSGGLPNSRSLADLRAEQQVHLDRIRTRMSHLDPKDLVPNLVARRLLHSQEMGAVYSKVNRADQLDKLIEILKTKNHWLGPVIDSLIRNGQGALAEELIAIKNGHS